MAAKKAASTRKSPKTALARTVFEGLRDEIVSGKFKPGKALSRRETASRYGTSYIPVVEAMARLESVGLIESKARQVARVRTITLETIEDDYVLREAVETQAIRMACERALESEIDELYERAKVVDAQVAERAERVKKNKVERRGPDEQGPLLHWQLHRRIAEISRSPGLVRELERIELLRRLQANWIFTPELPDDPEHHSRLVDAIQNRDPIAADAVMRHHVRLGLEKELLGYRINRTTA